MLGPCVSPVTPRIQPLMMPYRQADKAVAWVTSAGRSRALARRRAAVRQCHGGWSSPVLLARRLWCAYPTTDKVLRAFSMSYCRPAWCRRRPPATPAAKPHGVSLPSHELNIAMALCASLPLLVPEKRSVDGWLTSDPRKPNRSLTPDSYPTLPGHIGPARGQELRAVYGRADAAVFTTDKRRLLKGTAFAEPWRGRLRIVPIFLGRRRCV